MKKILRLSLDYEFEIKEIVEPSWAPGEYCRETVAKYQAIVNALVQNPGVLQELLRSYLYMWYNYECLYDEDTHEDRNIFTEDEITAYLKPYLPPCLVPYCMNILFCLDDNDSSLAKNDCGELFYAHIHNIKSVKFSLEEIDANGNPIFYKKETALADPSLPGIADRAGCPDNCIKNCPHHIKN